VTLGPALGLPSIPVQMMMSGTNFDAQLKAATFYKQINTKEMSSSKSISPSFICSILLKRLILLKQQCLMEYFFHESKLETFKKLRLTTIGFLFLQNQLY
jgi:hypothetical protein